MRKKLTPQWKLRADKKIHAKLFLLPIFQRAKIIFLYVSKIDEVDTRAFMLSLLKKKKCVVVPRVEEKELHLHTIKNFGHLEKGAFGILEPKKHRPEVKPKSIDVAIVPGIAFDRSGHRIGYGHGYFDRLLKKMKCSKIGLAYDFQMVDNIETHPYDVPVDFVITEKKIYVSKPTKRRS